MVLCNESPSPILSGMPGAVMYFGPLNTIYRTPGGPSHGIRPATWDSDIKQANYCANNNLKTNKENIEANPYCDQHESGS